MNLSKIELQEMLREMGLKFTAETSYDELRKMFQDENHRRWLGQNRPDGPKRVIRRRRTTAQAESASPPLTPNEEIHTSRLESSSSPVPSVDGRSPGKARVRPRRELPARRLKRLNEAPVVIDRQKNVFATVLRRARRRCELCDAATPEASAQDFLTPFYLVPVSEGGQEVIKNVVALCPECALKMESQPTPNDQKALKRKARQKVISSVVVIRR